MNEESITPEDVGKEVEVDGYYGPSTRKVQMVITTTKGRLAIFEPSFEEYIRRKNPYAKQSKAIRAFMEEHKNG